MHSTAVPRWLSDNKTYKVFVANTANRITLQHKNITWKYVSTKQNDADISSRGSRLSKLKNLWLRGPTWQKNIQS